MKSSIIKLSIKCAFVCSLYMELKSFCMPVLGEYLLCRLHQSDLKVPAPATYVIVYWLIKGFIIFDTNF